MTERIIAIATVRSDGLNLRAGPTDLSKSMDQLTVGDELEIYESTSRPAEYLRGRVRKVRNDVYAEDRTKQVGWVWTGGISLQPVAPPPRPIRDDGIKPWMWWAATAVIVGALLLLLLLSRA